jgi:uncharacterized protein YjbI with pentapeptide repeats
MFTTIEAGKHRAEHVALTGSSFQDVCVGDGEFENVSLVRAKLHNVNLSDVHVSYFQMGGATFTVGGSDPGRGQKPISFEHCQLVGASFRDCDLSEVRIDHCKLDGIRIDGVLVTDLMAAYRRRS